MDKLNGLIQSDVRIDEKEAEQFASFLRDVVLDYGCMPCNDAELIEDDAIAGGDDSYCYVVEWECMAE